MYRTALTLAALMPVAPTTAAAAGAEFERRAFPAPQSIWSVAAIDWDGDGRTDLIGMGETQVYVWLAPEWRRVTVADFADGKLLYCVAWDADGDGDMDLAVGRFRCPWVDYRKAVAEGRPAREPAGPDFSLGWIENTGRADEPAPFHVLDRELNGIHGLWTGDVSGDGRVDLVAGSILGPHFADSLLWYPAGAGDGERRVVTRGGATGRAHYLDVADLTGDGRAEVLLGASAGGTFAFWQRPERRTEWARREIGAEPGATNLRAADVDGDGTADVVASNGHGRGVVWFRGPRWERHVIDADMPDVHALDVADLTGNGHPDVACASFTAKTVVWFENDGRGNFRRHVIDASNDQKSYDLKIADIDGDGRPDLLLAGRNSNNVVWYRNRAADALAAPPAAHPADDLPPHVTRLTWFGERPDWRHDGQRFAFLNKVFGDAYEYELATGRIYPLTDHFTHHGFTRVLYLSNGDFLLVGPSETFDRTDRADRRTARHDTGVMSVLGKDLTAPPVSLGVECDEGPAVSRTRSRVAWTHGGQDRISVGDIVYEDGRPKLKDVRPVVDASKFPGPARIIETQNFVPPDERKLTLTGYRLGDGDNTETFLFDLESGELTNVSKSPESYDEAEGVFPDGKFTTVEHAPSRGKAWPLVDIYKLALDGSGRRERLTHFADHPGWKATQSVVSDDGKWMLFQIGKAGTEAGQGYGVFLYDFDKARAGR